MSTISTAKSVFDFYHTCTRETMIQIIFTI